MAEPLHLVLHLCSAGLSPTIIRGVRIEPQITNGGAVASRLFLALWTCCPSRARPDIMAEPLHLELHLCSAGLSPTIIRGDRIEPQYINGSAVASRLFFCIVDLLHRASEAGRAERS